MAWPGVVLRWLGRRPAGRLWCCSFWSPTCQVPTRRSLAPAGTVAGPARGGPCHQPLRGTPGLGAVLLDPLLMAVAALVLVALGAESSCWPCCLARLTPRWLNPLLEGWNAAGPRPGGGSPGPALGSLRLPAYPGGPWRRVGLCSLPLCRVCCCVQAFDLASQLDWLGWLSGFALAWTAGSRSGGPGAGGL